MPKVIVRSFAISVDGFSAGPNQDLEHPLGVDGEKLMDWFFATRVWQQMHKLGEGESGTDNQMAELGFASVGAWILGRNMFGPVRGPWPDLSWRGWWGEEPPYHTPVFVLTHHDREPLAMDGGTTFHFVTDGIRSALERAKAAAGDRDVRIGGGVSTIRQFLTAGLIDEMHLALRPVLFGAGENLWQGLDLRALGYEVEKQVAGERAIHTFVRRRAKVGVTQRPHE